MKNRSEFLTGLLLAFLAVPAYAQTASPLSQALSSASETTSQELATVTSQAVSKALSPKTRTELSHEGDALAPLAREKIRAHQSVEPQSTDSQIPPSQATAPPSLHEGRGTLYIEVAQRRLVMEAPLNMCFIDRTVLMQQGIYEMLAATVEKNNDQVLLGVFMPCNSVSSPDTWLNGMPETGFVTWMNPSIGDTTPMSLPDYLDMREASFIRYAKGRNLGATPDKTVHRTPYGVSLAVMDEERAQDWTLQRNVSVIATTLLRQVPIEITLHLPGSNDDHKGPPTFAEAYAIMDALVAQLVTLNK